MQLSSQAGTLAHRRLGQSRYLGPGRCRLPAPASASGTALVLVRVLKVTAPAPVSFSSPDDFDSPDQAPSHLFLSSVLTTFSTSPTFSGSPFLNACWSRGECSPVPLAVLICPPAQDAHREKPHARSHHSRHSHHRHTQPEALGQACSKAAGTARGAAPILGSCQPTPLVEEARPCHSAERNPPELYFYAAAPCASATALCNTSILDGTLHS